MPKVKPIVWDELNAELLGKSLEQATPVAVQVLIHKINEIIEFINAD